MPATVDTRTQTSHQVVKLDGQPLAQNVLANVSEITIQQDSVLPDAFCLRLHDIDTSPNHQGFFQIADSDQFAIGKEVQIGMGREDTPQPVLIGEITSIELEVKADGLPMLTVRGYDKSHRLHRQKRSRAFKQSTIADAIRQVAGGCGLSAQVQTTPVVYPQIMQANQTDWEFVRAMAHRVGMEAFVKGNKLEFRAPAATGQPIELTFGSTLRHLRLRMSASRQVASVEVRGWDPRTKQTIVGTANSPNQLLPKDKQRSGGAVSNVFGQGKYVLTDAAVRTQQEATQRAQSILNEIAGAFVQLECTGLGSADLAPGKQIRFAGVSNRFKGDYYISSATHRYTAEEGYLTTMEVSGSQPSGLLAMLGGSAAGAPAASRPQGTQTGVAVGIVTNNKDPEMGGRVKLKFPWLADALETDWVRIASPMAGRGRGIFWLPELDDEVLVAFEHGDINHPYVVGCLWNGRDAPPKKAAEVVGGDGKVNQRVIYSRSGHIITIDDTQGKENISIVDKTGKNSIKLDSPTNTLTVAVDGNMLFQADKGDIKVQSKTVTMQASDAVKINGRTINTEAQQGFTLVGLTADLQARSSMKIKGGSTTDVDASAKLSLNGGALTEVKGGLVKIN
jgi:phage protein D/phage baseplate assembly protein gpV